MCEEALKPSSERGAARKPLKGGRGVVRCWARLRGVAAEGGWGQKAIDLLFFFGLASFGIICHRSPKLYRVRKEVAVHCTKPPPREPTQPPR